LWFLQEVLGDYNGFWKDGPFLYIAIKKLKFMIENKGRYQLIEPNDWKIHSTANQNMYYFWFMYHFISTKSILTELSNKQIT